MISNIIVDVLNESSLRITKGRNLFAERSIGDQYVIVSTTSTSGDAYLPSVRYCSVNTLVVGWDIRDGSVISDEIARIVLDMEGNSFKYDNGTLTESYDILSVIIRNWPTLIPDLSIVAFTINIDLVYKQTNT